MLPRMCQLQIPQGGWKLVAVDNGSTDETNELLRTYSDRLPITILEHAQRGKNRALNAALHHIEGQLAVFTDDDVIPAYDWLIELEAAAATRKDYSIFGGRILPYWTQEPPSWLSQTVPMGIVYAITPQSVTEGPVPPKFVWGANMAVRPEVFDSGFAFDETVGPASGQYRMGSETEFTGRMCSIGYQCWHVSRAQVQHIIMSRQLTVKWIGGRAYRFGRSKFWIDVEQRSDRADAVESVKRPPKVFGLPRWYYRAAAESGLRWLASLVRRNEAWHTRATWDFAYWRGYFCEALRSRLSKKNV
jgi:glycosyltransferase involved in cell wall biosynthesis